MSATTLSAVDSLIEAAKRLSDRERGEFLDRLLDLDHDEEQPLSAEWTAEIERRIAEDEAGQTTWHSLEAVIAEARDTLNRPA